MHLGSHQESWSKQQIKACATHVHLPSYSPYQLSVQALTPHIFPSQLSSMAASSGHLENDNA